VKTALTGTLAVDTTDGNNVTDRGIDITNTGAFDLGVVDAGDGTVNITTTGDTTQSGALTAANLAFRSDGAATLDNAANDITNLAAALTGAGKGFTFKDADALTTGTAIDGINGVRTNNGAIDISTVDGTLTIGQGTEANDIASGGGTIALTAGSNASGTTDPAKALVFANGALVNTTDGDVILTAQNMNINDADVDVTTDTLSVDAGAGTVTIQPEVSGTEVLMGAGAADVNTADGHKLAINNAELANIGSGKTDVDVGDGDFRVQGQITNPGTDPLEITTNLLVGDHHCFNDVALH